MKRIALDTNAVSHLFRGDEKVLKALNEADTIFLPYFVIAELLVGFKRGSREEENISLLSALEKRQSVRRLYPSDTTIEIYSEVFYDLKQKGRPIPVHDIWIASLAIEYGSVIITYDQHFKEIDKARLWKY